MGDGCLEVEWMNRWRYKSMYMEWINNRMLGE